MKYFRLSYDAILWEISYTNYVMLQATIPVFESDEEDNDKKVSKAGSSHEGIDSLANYLNL